MIIITIDRDKREEEENFFRSFEINEGGLGRGKEEKSCKQDGTRVIGYFEIRGRFRAAYDRIRFFVRASDRSAEIAERFAEARRKRPRFNDVNTHDLRSGSLERCVGQFESSYS